MEVLSAVAMRQRLQASMGWLARAQRPSGGFSAAFSYVTGWAMPYPETTGYIIETLLKYSAFAGQRRWREMGRRAGEWLLQMQLPDGAFPGGHGVPPVARVFNTGMILFGLRDLLADTGDQRFADAGLRTLSWLAAIQEPNGSWVQASLGGAPHAYQALVALAILDMAEALGVVDRFAPTVVRSNTWVLAQECKDGWYAQNELLNGLPPLTHNIAYVAHGLLECGQRLEIDEWIAAATRTAEALYADWRRTGFLAAGYGRGWSRGPRFRCVTGEAQIGILWHRLWQITGEEHWLEGARGAASQVAGTQAVRHLLAGVRGAVPGSWPMWGSYLRFAFPNWAAKFFADLLLALQTD